MAQMTLRDENVIGNYQRPYVIAEVNSSHNGDVGTAERMIKAAKDAGCHCVKVQSWSAQTLYSKTYYKSNPIAQRIVAKFALSEDKLKECAAYCKDVGIAFSSTPYSEAEVDALLNMGVPYIKIASMDINNYGFLKYIAETKAPIILSTGMAEIEEVKKAVEIIKTAGNERLALLHCISIYPAAANTIHLNNIAMLQSEFPDCPVGFSDHTLGTEIACAATALGAAIIEKHLTLDKTKPGMDNNMAIEPDEMAALVKNCANVYEAMGSKTRIVSGAEYEQRQKMRRSVIAAGDLKAGTVLSLTDLSAKRPGDGISVDQLETLVGKTLKHDVEADTLLKPEDFV